MTSTDLTGGLPLSQESVITAAPEDPKFREAVNIWVQDDQGRFALPRIGVEAVSESWGSRGVHANVAFLGGRVLVVRRAAEAIGPYDREGHPVVFGAGPIEFRCVTPFERWTMAFHGAAQETTVADQAAGKPPHGPLVPVTIEVDMTMAVPAWLRGQMSEEIRRSLEGNPDVSFIGGYNYKQLFRASGVFRADEEEVEFSGTGLRIHRQGVRDTTSLRGHCWQEVLFPSGRAIAYISHLPHPDGTPGWTEGWVFDGEHRFPATVVKVPWMTTFEPEGGDVSFVLESELGTARVHAETHISTVTIGSALSASELIAVSGQTSGIPGGLLLHQGSARCTWESETGYGMVERSYPIDQIAR